MALLVLTSIAPANAPGGIAFGTWRDINPTQYSSADPTAILRGIYVRNGGSGSIGAGDGWVVGGDGANSIIAHYDGFSWELRTSPTGIVYYSASFCTSPGSPSVGLCSPNGDGTDGWIVGGPNTGGAAALYWDGSALTPSTGLPATVTLKSVFMICHSGASCPGALAYAVGTDGGQGVIYGFNGIPPHGGGWTLEFTDPSTTSYNGVYMYIDQSSHLAGFAVGAGGVVATYTGTWVSAVVDGGLGVNFNSVMVDQGNPADAWAVGDVVASHTQIWHFTSGIWTGYVSPQTPPANLESVFLTSTSEGWIVGAGGTILHSTTLGSSNVWLALTQAIQTAVGSGIDLYGTSFPAGGNGWAVGADGVILHTENSACGNAVPSPCWGGSTSITQVTPTQELNAVFELGSNDAWAGGSWDTTSGVPSLIHWDGDKWHRATVAPAPGPTTPDIFGIYMLSSSEGWAVGGGPAGVDTAAAALKWNGNTWTGHPIPSCGTCYPRSVFMVNSGDGYAVGTSGTIWRFQSGTWGVISSPTTNQLNSVFISNPGDNTNAGWAVGNSGTVLKLTITGGNPTWNVVGVPGIVAQNLNGVYFKDSNHGWIVGDSGTIVSTYDGGNTWSGGAGVVPGATLRSVFIDTFGTGSGNGDGWAVGDDGAGNALMVHWDGSAWTITPVTPYGGALAGGLSLFSVYLTSPTDGFAVGAGVSGITSLSGIFHLDPPNSPSGGGGGGGGSVTTVTTTATSTPQISTSITSSSSAATSSTSVATTQSATSVQTTLKTSVATTTAVKTVTLASSTPTTETTSSVAVTTPLAFPGIPGFPWESIIGGIVVGLTALALIRRRRRSEP